MEPKKMSLEVFQANELSVGEMKKIMAGSGTTKTEGGSTTCSGTDHDNGNPDSD